MAEETPQHTVTLATIAAHLGVSRSTVSNAYNRPDQLSADLRQRVLDAARKLGYTGPDPVARRLRKGRSGAIGVLFCESLQTSFADVASVLFLEGVAAATEDADTGLLLIPARPSPQTANAVNDAMVDGFLLYSIPPTHPFVQVALERHVPVVCVDQTDIPGVSWVGIDDRSAARQAAEHLLQLGHRDFSILVYGLGDVPSEILHSNAPLPDEVIPSVSLLRVLGYRDALTAAGVAWKSVTLHHSPTNSPADGARAAHELFSRTSRPTAILATSDALALGALETASQLGISVPNELSLVGFDDLPEASLNRPALTTVRQPLKEKGLHAAAILLEDRPQVPHRIRLSAELVVRDTTGPAPLRHGR